MPNGDRPQGPKNQPSLRELMGNKWKPGKYWTNQDPQWRRHTFAPYKVPVFPGPKGDYSSLLIPRQYLDTDPGGVIYNEDKTKATIDPYRYEELLRQRFKTAGTKPTTPEPDQMGYWENPYRIARYQGAITGTPEGTQVHPGVPQEQIDMAYRLMQYENNDRPWWEWDYPEEGSMTQQFLRSIPPPPDELLLADEKQWETPTQEIQTYEDIDAPRIRVEEIVFAETPEEGQEKYKQLILEGHDPQAIAWQAQEVEAGIPDRSKMSRTQKWTMATITSPEFMGAMSTWMAGGPAGSVLGTLGQWATGATLGNITRWPVVGPIAKVGMEVLNYLYSGLKGTVSIPFIFSEYVLEQEVEGYDATTEKGSGKARLEMLQQNYARGWIETSKQRIEHLESFDWKAAWQAGQFIASAVDIPFVKDRRHSFNELWKDYESPFGGEPENLGLPAMMQIYHQIEGGADPENVMRHWTQVFGVEGLAMDLMGGVYLDPYTYAYDVSAASRPGQALAAKVGGPEMVAALKAAKGKPIETMKVYAQNMREGYAGGEVPRDVSELRAFDRVLAGIAKPGETLDDLRLSIKGIEPEGEGVITFRPGGEAPRPTAEALGEIRTKIEEGKPLTPEEYRVFGEELATRTVEDTARKLDPVETQFIALDEGNKIFEDALQNLREGGLPADEGVYIDIRATPRNAAHARSDGKPSFAGRVGGALASGGWAALLGAGLNPIVGFGMGALMMIPGFGQGLRRMLSLTPAAQATRITNSVVDHITATMEPIKYIKDADAAVEAARIRIRSLADTPHMAARELSMESLARPEGAVLPFALKNTEDVVNTMVSRWYDSKKTRAIFESVGEVLGYKSVDLMKKALTDAGAKSLFDEYVRAIDGIDSAKVGDIKKSIENGDFTAKSFKGWAEKIENNLIPKSIDHWFAQFYDGLASSLGKWAVDWYGVEPEGTVIRFSQTIKASQGLLLLSMNPIYFTNNVATDAVAMLTEGVFGIRTKEQLAEVWERMGFEPTRLHQGIAPDADLGAIRATEAIKPIREAQRVEGPLQKARDWMNVFKNKVGFVSKGAHKWETWAGEQATASGVMQFMGRFWPSAKPDPHPALRAALDAIDPKLNTLLDEATSMSLNAGELREHLASEVARLGVVHWSGEVAEQFNLSPADARGLLYKTGVHEFLAARLLDTNVETVRQAFSDVHQHIRDNIFDIQSEQLPNVTRMIAQEIATEGAQKALSHMNNMYVDQLQTRLLDYHEWQKVFAQRSELSQPDFSALVNRQRAAEVDRYRIYYNRARAEWLGVLKGLGLESESAVKFNDTIIRQEDMWTDFYGLKSKLWDEFGKRIFDTGKEAKVAIDDIRREINEAYARVSQDEMRLMEERDALFVDMVRTEHGSRAADEMEFYLSKVRDARDEIYMANRMFHDQVMRADWDTRRRDTEYTKFLQETIRPLWMRMANEGLRGIDEFYSVIRSGEQPAAAPEGPPTEPVAEPEPVRQPDMFSEEEVAARDLGRQAQVIASKLLNGETLSSDELVFHGEHKADIQGAMKDTRNSWKTSEMVDNEAYAKQIAEQYDVAISKKTGEPVAEHIRNIVNLWNAEGKQYDVLGDVPQEVARQAFEARAADKIKTAERQKTFADELKRKTEEEHEETREEAETLAEEVQDETWLVDEENVEIARDESARLNEANVYWDGMKQYLEAGGDLGRVATKHLPEGVRAEIETFAEEMVRDIAAMTDDATLIDHIATYEGGVSTSVRRDLTSEETGAIKDVPPGFFQEGGMELGDLAPRLRDDGYLYPGQGAYELEPILMRALRGEDIYSIGHRGVDWFAEMETAMGVAPNAKTVLNTLKRIASGEMRNVANAKTRPWLINYILDELSGPSGKIGREAGHPGLLYLLGREQDAARAATAWEHIAPLELGNNIERWFGNASIADRVFDVRLEMGNDVYKDTEGIVETRLAEDMHLLYVEEPSRRTLEREQERVIEEAYRYYSDKVKVRDALRARMDDWDATTRNPELLPPGDARSIYRDYIVQATGDVDKAVGWMKLLDIYAKNQVKAGNFETVADYWQKSVAGYMRGEGGEMYQPARPDVIINARSALAGHTYKAWDEMPGWDAIWDKSTTIRTGYVRNGDWISRGGSAITSDDFLKLATMDELRESGITAPARDTGGEYQEIGIGWNTGSVKYTVLDNQNRLLHVYGPLSGRQATVLTDAIRSGRGHEVIYVLHGPNPARLATGQFSVVDGTAEFIKYVDEVYKGAGDSGMVEKPLSLKGGLLYQQPWYYSRLEEVIRELPMEKMQVAQLEGMLRNAGGIKQDEMYWTGLKDWIKAQDPDSVVLKQDVLDAYEAVRIEETVLGEQGVVARELFAERAQLVAEWDARKKSLNELEYGERMRGIDELWDIYAARLSELGTRIETARADSEKGIYPEYVEPGGEGYRELIITWRGDEYADPHFPDLPGAVVHIRFNERLDVDGKQVLFVEEIQSGRHQEGRAEGYKGPPLTEQETLQVRRLSEKIADTGLTPDESKLYDILRDKRSASYREVPPAPFAKTWDELAMKRLIVWAVENGYERIGWTTPDMQVARYPVGIAWDYMPAKGQRDAFWSVEVKAGENMQSMGSHIVKAKDDLNYVPSMDKKWIDKTWAAMGEESGFTQPLREGMESFYGRILSWTAEKVGKDWGVKVGETEIEGETIPFFDITPEMRASVEQQGLPLFQPEARAAHGQDFQLNRGGIEFLNDGRAMFNIFNGGDITTVIHETGHLLRRQLVGADQRIAADWAGAKRVEDLLPSDDVMNRAVDDEGVEWAWTRDAEEKFGKGFEKYIYEGKAPNSALEAIYLQLRTWMQEIYQLFSGEYFKDIELTPEVRNLFDRLFDEQAYKQLETQAKGQGELFVGGEDTPLMSGTPMRGRVEQFRPQEQAGQDKMFDTSPAMKAGKQSIVTGSKVRTPDGEGEVLTKNGLYFVVNMDEGGIRNYKAEDVEPSVAMQGGLFQEPIENPQDLRDIGLENFPDIAHAWGEYPTGQKRIIAYTDNGILIQHADGKLEHIVTEGEAPPTVGMKMGTYEDLTTTNIPPNARMTEEGYMTLLKPLLDAIESRMVSDDALVTNGLGGKTLDDATAKMLRQYTTEVEGALAQTKHAAIGYADMKRTASLLNYQQRMGFDNVTEAVMPYQFFYGRAGMNWMMRLIDKPVILANQARLMNIGRRVYGHQPIQKPGFPSRLKGKVKIPLPSIMLPDWAEGGVYIDPWHLLFPHTLFTKPFKQEFEQEEQKKRQAVYVIEGMYDDDEITVAQAKNAIQTMQGPIWDKAMQQAEVRVEGENSSPLDFIEVLTGYGLPVQYASDMIEGKGEEQGLLPFSRLVKNATAWAVPGGWEPFKPIRGFLGLPDRDKWAEYHIVVTLGNMAVAGEIPLEEARLAMIEQKGPVWEKGLDRAGKQDSLEYLFSTFWGDFFPEGEQRARALGEEFGKAMTSQDEGAVNRFFDDHPEYEARMQVFDWEDPEVMLRQYLIGEVWDGYIDRDQATKRKIRKAMDEDFHNAFLNRDTRNYDAIPTEKLLAWAKQLGQETPDVARPVTYLGEEIVSPEYEEQGQLYEQAKEGRFGEGIDVLEQYFFSLPEDSQERAEFEQLFPEVSQMRNWETLFLDKHPDLIAELGHTKIRDASKEMQELYQTFQAQRIRLFGPELFDHMDIYYSMPEELRQPTDLLRAYWYWKYDVWLVEHPELSSYVTSGEVDAEQAKEDAYKELVVGNLWDAYFEYGDDQRRVIRSQFDDNFMQYFINKDTRDYDKLTLEELQGWAEELGAEQPNLELGFAIPVNTADWDASLIRQLNGYYYANQSLSTGALRILRQEWENAGSPGGSLEEWIDTQVKLSVEQGY